MIKSSPWPKLLPPLAIVLAAVLVVAAGTLWLGEPSGDGTDGGLGKLMAVAQAVRADARGTLAGDTEAFGRLADGAAEVARLRKSLGTNDRVAELVNGGNWQRLESEIVKVGAAREVLLGLHAARERLLELAPQMLASTANLASALSPADLAANQPYLDRFELTVESIQQNVRALAAATAVGESVQRLNDAEQYFESDHPRPARRGSEPRHDAGSRSGRTGESRLRHSAVRAGARRNRHHRGGRRPAQRDRGLGGGARRGRRGVARRSIGAPRSRHRPRRPGS